MMYHFFVTSEDGSYKVCMENDDVTEGYTIIATISPSGTIHRKVSLFEIPDEANSIINACAYQLRNKFRSEFESMPPIRQYAKMLAEMPEHVALNWAVDRRSVADKLEHMKEQYFEMV